MKSVMVFGCVNASETDYFFVFHYDSNPCETVEESYKSNKVYRKDFTSEMFY